MNAAEITDKIGLHGLRNRNWYIQATCATSGDGLYEGLDWLSNQLKNAKWSHPVIDIINVLQNIVICVLFWHFGSSWQMMHWEKWYLQIFHQKTWHEGSFLPFHVFLLNSFLIFTKINVQIDAHVSQK